MSNAKNLKFKKVNKRREFRVPIAFTMEQLDFMIIYLFTDSLHIKRKDLHRMQQLFKILEPSIYEKDVMLDVRYQFINSVLDSRLKESISDYNIVIDRAYEDNSLKDELDDVIDMLEDSDDLNEADIRYVTNLVAEHSTYAYLFKHKDKILDCLEDLELGTENLRELNGTLRYELTQLMKEMRQAKPNNDEENDFDLSQESLTNDLLDTVRELRQPSNYLQTGFQSLNRMLNGGFEQDRHYLLFGISGVGKSVILLTIAYHIMKYNQHLKPKSPEKKLCVLYITQENSRKETIQRLWNIAVHEDDITEFSDEEVLKMFQEAGLNMEDSNINLRIMYRPNKSISTDDLYDIIDTIHDEGEEVIAVVHDYTKRILPSNPTNDMRIDLGAVVDEETVIAKTYHIPFITAGQLNRAGAATIEEALQRGKEDVGKLLNSTNVGESFLMIENTDWAGIINREYKETSNTTYMTFKEIKARSKKKGNEITYFAQPFEKGNSIKLVEDFNFKAPASLYSLSQDTSLDKGAIMEKRRGNISGRRKANSEPAEQTTARGLLDSFDIDAED